MSSEYLVFRCPNRGIKGVSYECRAGCMDGPSIETLNSHDFDASPFVDLRYCKRCGVHIKITIKNMNSQPHYKILSEEEHKAIKYKSVEDVFGGYTVEGCRIKVIPAES